MKSKQRIYFPWHLECHLCRWFPLGVLWLTETTCPDCQRNFCPCQGPGLKMGTCITLTGQPSVGAITSQYSVTESAIQSVSFPRAHLPSGRCVNRPQYRFVDSDRRPSAVSYMKESPSRQKNCRLNLILFRLIECIEI